MTEFDFESMRYVLSPLQVVEELAMSTQGLVRARIVEPQVEEFSVLGYDFMWNREGLALPTETERLRVVELALGENSLDLTVALILPNETQEEINQTRERLEVMKAEFRERSRVHALEQERDLLDHKKRMARMQIISEAGLTADAIDLIKREVMVENPDLQFPESESYS